MFGKNIATVKQHTFNGYKCFKKYLSTANITLQKDIPSNAYTMGTCGTTKWQVESKKEDEKEMDINLPAHLIRPPCIPGSQPGGFQTCMMRSTEGGMYCIPCKENYKYPSFSENIDFVPPRETTCWWLGVSECHQGIDNDLIEGMTQPCPFDIDP